jgi:hypothetical protein
MPKDWCVNFVNEAAFVHSIKNKLCSIGYQYGDTDSTNWIGRIRLNWQRLEELKPGDEFVAYRKSNRFFATGTVRTPRRAKGKNDRTDTISAYLDRRESYDDGFIYFTGTVVYENFTDDLDDLPVRIDVESWENYVPDGIVLPIVNKVVINERQLAVFEIEKADFGLIMGKLQAERGSALEDHGAGGLTAAEDHTVVEALEKSVAKSQGFLLNSKLRKALEDYAMEAATKYFRSKGYDVDDHHKDHSYDLLCIKKKEKLYVEVKGTQANGEGIILTSGEVEFARHNKKQMVLFVLHAIKVLPDQVLDNGEKSVVWPWDVDQGSLKPISYWYEQPGGPE